MELLICMAALNPVNSFASYYAQKVMRLAQLYHNDISSMDLLRLEPNLKSLLMIWEKMIRSYVSIILVSSLLCLLKQKTCCLWFILYVFQMCQSSWRTLFHKWETRKKKKNWGCFGIYCSEVLILIQTRANVYSD